MFWDKAAKMYDLFEDLYNGKVNRQLSNEVGELIDVGDCVLECACGTGLLSRSIATKAQLLTATDYSEGMLKQARKKCANFGNIVYQQIDITKLPYCDNQFDKVVAGNVIHLLDNPEVALCELVRVCKVGGKIIIPTYVNNENAGTPNWFVRMLEKVGVSFKRQFNFQSYQQFFALSGYPDARFSIVNGKMPCAIAVISKSE